MPDHARQPTPNISPSGREPDSKDFVRSYWTANLKLRYGSATEAVKTHSLLRQMPPRQMCNQSLAGIRQKNPGGQKSPRAPMTASATFAPRAGASGGFHRSTNCKFPAPVLRACSSAHRIPEPRDCNGCRRSPTAPSAKGRKSFCREFCGPLHFGGYPLRFPDCTNYLVRPLQRTKIFRFNVRAQGFTGRN